MLVNATPLEDGAEAEGQAPVWAVFGDLMAGVLGAFVLILVFALGLQLDLAQRLQAEVQQRQAEQQRRQALEAALAGPLAAGRVSFEGGRIGISGQVLFAFNSAELQPQGRDLLQALAGPLTAYLAARDEVLMVSGYTDDRPVREASRAAARGSTRRDERAAETPRFADNWELSAQRALTVMRALIDAGLPQGQVFAAAFGAEQPVASNASAEGRALNRRVELSPTPRVQREQVAAPPPVSAPGPR